jgi:hypothetical protein
MLETKNYIREGSPYFTIKLHHAFFIGWKISRKTMSD